MSDQAFLDGRLIMDSKQDLADEVGKLRAALIDTQSLLAAMLLEPRPTEEIEAQIMANRAVLGDYI